MLQQRVKMLREQVQHRQAQMLQQGEWTLLGEYRLSRAAAFGATVPKVPPGPRYDCSGQPYEAAPVS
jgi:hypothetical protein